MNVLKSIVYLKINLMICSNKRVTHLAQFGKTKRVRAKNLKRAIKINEKEGVSYVHHWV